MKTINFHTICTSDVTPYGYHAFCSWTRLMIVLFFFLLLPVLHVVHAQTVITITKDTTLNSDLEIPPGTTLRILPGVIIQFEGYRTLIVKGRIEALGTELEPIVFTGEEHKDESVGKPSWKGIEVVGKDASGQFKYCYFKKAFRNLVWEASPSFDKCTFTGNYYGLYCTRYAESRITDCHFEKNVFGIALDNAAPQLSRNSVSKNTTGIYMLFCAGQRFDGNSIMGNKTDIQDETGTEKNLDIRSSQVLWNLMQQIY